MLDLLAITSLDQKFDVETVASEARVVLQELYLDKYDAKGQAKRQFDAALYGPSHPYTHDTTETEIAAARTPPPRLAAELAQYSQLLKLPANMDLFLVGEFDPGSIGEMVRKSFGRFAFAEGPKLDVPQVGVTRAHVALNGVSKELRRPMSEMRIAWNTGVGVTESARAHADGARRVSQQGAVLRAQGEVRRQLHAGGQLRHRQLLGHLRDQDRQQQQSRGCRAQDLRCLGHAQDTLDPTELRRFSDRLELKRRQGAQSNAELLECMVERTVHGASSHDFEVRGITVDDIRAAARNYLPAHRGAYVRLALLGQ